MAQKILIADDEPDLLRLMESRLKACHYEVIATGDGETCLELAKEERPELIILDVVMPGRDGFEVLHALKHTAETSAIPVIMLTQKVDSGSILDGQDLGATDYLCKPFHTDELLKVIRRYI